MGVVLLVEDQALVAETIGLLLRKQGYHVVLATNGNDGLTKFSEFKPDLVITDIIMPEQEGIGLIIALRKRAPEIPILAYSGGGRSGPSDYLETAKILGATEVMRKPFSNQHFLETVERLMRGQM